MKSRVAIVLSIILSFAVSAQTPEMHHAHLSGEPVREEKVEIVVQNKTPLMEYVSVQLKEYLDAVMGKEVSIVEAPTEGMLSIVLGDCELSRAAGIDVGKLPNEGYVIRRKGNSVFLAGVDSETSSPTKNSGINQSYQRATLNASIDFLERFADMRFYFADEMGIIVPKGKGLWLPAEIDIREAPDYSFRRISSGNSKYQENAWLEGNHKGIRNYAWRQVVLRMAEFNIPYTHGLAQVNMIERFAKTHPEYFALKPNGTRYNNPAERHPGQLCFSSGVVEEIYQDAKAYFQGKAPSERGLKTWGQAARRNYFCVMPQDSLYWCGCEKCAKIAPAAYGYNNDKEAARRIDNFMWKFTADIANRLTAEGIDGIITQMPYGVMKPLPDVPLPKNLSVHVAVKALGKREDWDEDKALIKQWYDKVGCPVSLWTYPGKHMAKKDMKGLPNTMFHQMGEYFQYMGPYLCGAYLEDETDHEIYLHLDFYIYSRIAWNRSLSVQELLADYYRHMYGSAGCYLEAFFNEMEELWCNKVLGNSVDTAIGPVVKLPTDYEVWQKHYSPERRKAWDMLFDKAMMATTKEPECQKRVAFMRERYLGAILKEGMAFDGRTELIRDWKVSVPGEVWLRAYKGEVNEVSTRVGIRRENGSFVFTFECEEPHMTDIMEECTVRDDIKVFSDSCVELLVNPSGDRRNYYHFGVNANGTLSDAACQLNEKPDWEWNCEGATTTAEKTEQGFTVTITVPEASIAPFKPEGFPVNFARHRVLKTIIPNEIYYQWSPVTGISFHYLERYGTLALEPQAPTGNLLQDPDFLRPVHNTWKLGNWNFSKTKASSGEGQSFEMDKRVFLFGGQSPHVTNATGQSFIVSQKFNGMQPSKRYRISYYLRTKDVEPGEQGVGAWLVMGSHQEALPRTRITGTTAWHPQTFIVTSPADITPETECSIGLWNWKHKGESWFDHVEIVPVQ